MGTQVNASYQLIEHRTIVGHTKKTEWAGESVLYPFIKISYFINQEKLFIDVQCNRRYQCIKNICHQQVHQGFYVEIQKGEDHKMIFLY